MSDLIPTSSAVGRAPAQSRSPLARAAQRGLQRLEYHTLMRVAGVQAEGMVQTEKLREVDSLTREAMTGHALLYRHSDVLAASDLFLADELKFFRDISRLGKGEIITDTIDSYCRESRR
jgi:hypothetical protein